MPTTSLRFRPHSAVSKTKNVLLSVSKMSCLCFYFTYSSALLTCLCCDGCYALLALHPCAILLQTLTVACSTRTFLLGAACTRFRAMRTTSCSVRTTGDTRTPHTPAHLAYRFCHSSPPASPLLCAPPNPASLRPASSALHKPSLQRVP